MTRQTSLVYVAGFLLVAVFINFVTQLKFNNIKQTYSMEMENSTNYVSVAKLEKELQCLAINIYKEAGYEPVEGRVAVAQVTMNRVNHPEFPKTVCDVVFQRTVNMSRIVCQFSWHCDSVHSNRLVNQEKYLESYAIAKKVMMEGLRLEKLNDALFYHADYVSPNWRRYERVTKIGRHIFYKQMDT
jgi:spore germination cell wall hydrolase CwlJ-like protein